MSASEGELGHGKADIKWKDACISLYKFAPNSDKGEGSKNPKILGTSLMDAP